MQQAAEPKRKRVAFLIEHQFEDAEFQVPYAALKEANAEVVVLGSRMNDEYVGRRGQKRVKPDATTTEVRAEDFDALVIPGGQAPDQIRSYDQAVRLVMNAMAQGKIVAAICHGPQVLIEADQLQGRRTTGFHSIRTDLRNAGATYVDEAVVVDDNLITSRRPGDMALFTLTLLSTLGLLKDDQSPLDAAGDRNALWQMAKHWGGSTRGDIVDVLNTALIGERYTLAAFSRYVHKTNYVQAKAVFQDVIATKGAHVQLLEARLKDLGETVIWQTVSSDALATLQSWLLSQDDVSILRRALGDIQTGATDAARFAARLTDPATTDLMIQIAKNLSRHEERLGDLYRAHQGADVKPPMPTTVTGL